MADGSHLVRAQAVSLSERVMFSALIPLGATIELPDGFALEAMTPDAIVGEMNVAICGEWLGHPAGPFAMDADKMQQCIDRFVEQANPMVVDYEHKSLGGVDGRAAGWIHRLSLKGTGEGAELWATVEWCKPAAEMIRNGEYRYCSPVIDFGGKDRVTGEHVPVELFNVAITNQPFLDGMHPVALSRVVAAKQGDGMPEDDEQKPEGNLEAAPEGGETKVEVEVEGAGPEEGEEEGAEAEGEQTGFPFEGKPAPAAAEDPNKLTAEAALAAFVDQVCSTSGGSKAAVLAALTEGDLADQVGGIVRTRLETTDGSASDAQEIPMSNDKTSETVDKDEVLLALAKELGALRTELAEEKAMRLDASKKAATESADALDKANEARIEAMLSDGRLAASEMEPARSLLCSKPALFEEIYGKRVAGSASPVGRRQATDAASDPQSQAAGEDAQYERDLAKLSEPERKAFSEFVKAGKDPKATLRRMLSANVRSNTRMVAARVGVPIPE